MAERLWEKYHQFVYRFFAQRGFTEDERRDLTQDVYLRVIQGISGLRLEAAARGWMQEIVSSVWKNELRRRQAAMRGAPVTSLETLMATGEPQPSEPLPGAIGHSRDPFDERAHKEEVQQIRQAWKELPPQPRRCLGLYVQGLSYKEISDLLDISIQTVKPHIHKARKRLREKLRAWSENHDR